MSTHRKSRAAFLVRGKLNCPIYLVYAVVGLGFDILVTRWCRCEGREGLIHGLLGVRDCHGNAGIRGGCIVAGGFAGGIDLDIKT